MKNIFTVILCFAFSAAFAQNGTINRIIGTGNNSIPMMETEFGGAPPLTLPSTISIYIDTLGEDSVYINNNGVPVFLEPGAPKYTVSIPDGSGPQSGTIQADCGGEYQIDVRTIAATVNPPANPPNGCAFTINDYYRSANANWISIAFDAAAQKYNDLVRDYIFNHNGHKATFIWSSADQSWSTESEN